MIALSVVVLPCREILCLVESGDSRMEFLLATLTPFTLPLLR